MTLAAIVSIEAHVPEFLKTCNGLLHKHQQLTNITAAVGCHEVQHRLPAPRTRPPL